MKEILVVDDNVDILKLLCTLLQHEYKVRVVNNGALAIKSIVAKQPDIVLLDVIMPDLNGMETCKIIKKNNKISHIPVIFLSALRDETEIKKGLLAGGVDFINKPFSSEILLLRLRIHLKLAGLQQELKLINQSLQQKVETRTKILLETNNELIRLKYALQASYTGIWDWDLRKNKFTYNDVFFTLLGYESAQFLLDSKLYISLLHPADLAPYQQQIDQCLNNQSSEFQIEYRLQRADESYCWILSKGIVVERDQYKIPIRMTGTFTDISVEKDKQ